MTDPIDPWIHVSGKTLAGYRDRPDAVAFLDALAIIADEEHGADSPDGLHGFRAILDHAARTPDLDRDLLVPYFVRYLWEITFPSYLREAWRSLNELMPDREMLAEVARSVLEQHPSGELRAGILAEHTDRPPARYLTARPMVDLLLGLVGDDPAPQVRRNALALLLPADADEDDQRRAVEVFVHALRDPAAEVRCAAFEQLCLLPRGWRGSAPDGGAPSAQLIQAIQDPLNTPVLPAMLWAMVRSLGTGPQQMAAMLNAVSAQRRHPRFADMMRAMDFLFMGAGATDGPVALAWLEQAPFADAAALQACLHATFEARTRPALDRAAALVGLDSMGLPRTDQEIIDFVLEQPQTGASLELLSQAHAFWRRIFTVAFGQARSPVALFAQLIDRSSALSPDGVARSVKYRSLVCDKALRHALTGGVTPALAAELAASVFDVIRRDAHDLSSALYPLRDTTTELDMSGLQDVVQSACNIYAARYAAQVLARRFAKFRDERLLRSIEGILTDCRDLALAAELVGGLPPRSQWADQPLVLARLTAAVSAAMQMPAGETPGYDQWRRERINGWLS